MSNLSSPAGSRTVVFVGAGASAPTGYPVTGQLLERIWAGLLNDDAKKGWKNWAGMRPSQNGKAKHQRLLDLLRHLYPGLEERGAMDAASIVDVLSLTDLLVSEGRSAHALGTHALIREQRALLNVAMNGVLRGSGSPSIYRAIAKWLFAVAGRGSASRVSIITTNYDTLLEDALYKLLRAHRLDIAQLVDFGLSWRPAPSEQRVVQRPQSAPFACLKLHGSLNWLRCENCGFVTINPGTRIHSLDFWEKRSPKKFNICDCEGLLRGTLVVPSSVRDVRDANLLGVWQAALEEIRVADRLVVIGYSLPAEDITVRSMLVRALNSRPQVRGKPKPIRVEVVQRDSAGAGGSALARFRMLFSPAQLQESQCHGDGVKQWLSDAGVDATEEDVAAAARRLRKRA